MAHHDVFDFGLMNHIPPPETQNVPVSLFNTTIPRIKASASNYYKLKNNTDIPMENEDFRCSIRTKKLTTSNWKTLLNIGCKIYIPITFGIVHHKIIQQYGHDKLVELEYIGQSRIHNDTQLNFKLLNTPLFPLFHACRISKLDIYEYPIMVEMTEDQIQRDTIRYQIIAWRTATRKTEQKVMEILKKEFHHTRMSGILNELRKLLTKRTIEEN